MRPRAGWLIGSLVGLAACSGATDAPSAPSATEEVRAVRYVALGDSYTIGTAVTEEERWPNQLDRRVAGIELVGNPAVNGYTSGDLVADELPQLDGLRPEFVSVLIGVNDVVQGVPDERYAANVARIIDALVARVGPNRIVCVATPDYTRTPRGAEYGDPGEQSERIVRVNAILREACEARSVTFVPEIFAISRAASVEPELVAGDGLHPSGEQYRRWVDVIAPVVEDLLTRPAG